MRNRIIILFAQGDVAFAHIVVIVRAEQVEMADAEEVRMLAEITRLYYEEEWTQQRIAKKFTVQERP